MTLLNGILAFGALAFTIPLVIHLMFRSRFRTIEWGAMHLLDSVMRINRRRLELMQLLLLLLRCLLPILLALCLAAPVLTGFQSLPGDQPRTVVIVIDDSRSMEARSDDNRTRIEQAKRDASELLSGLTRRDEVMFLTASAANDKVGTMGVDDALTRLRQLDAGVGPVDLGRMVRAAVEAVQEASHPNRQIVVLSDFQSNIVDESAMESLRRLEPSLAESTNRPAISFLDVSEDSAELSNLSVDAITIDSPAVVAGRTAKFSARIRNGSDLPISDLRTVWSMDAKPMPPRSISIAPRSSATVRWTQTIADVGVHTIGLSIEHGDALLPDNSRVIGVDAMREISVLIVDGKPSSQPLESETAYLSIALSPFAFGGEDQPDAVRTETVNKRGLSKEISLWNNDQSEKSRPDIVILANVDEVDATDRQAIAQFVQAGGSLIVFDGDAIKASSYNEPWKHEGGEWGLPATMGDIVGAEASSGAEPLAIGQVNAQYTPWRSLAPQDQNPFAELEIYGYRKLAIEKIDSPTDENAEAVAETESAPITLWSMASGDPIVVSRRRGAGKVIQVAIPCDADWSTLPIRMIYLPMIQQLVLDLAGSSRHKTVEIGSDLVVPIDEFSMLAEQTAPAERGAARKNVVIETTYSVQSPKQPEREIVPNEQPRKQLQVNRASESGVYRFRQLSSYQSENEPVVTQTLRVVQVPAIESQLRDADPERMSEAAASIGATIYRDVESLRADDQTRRHGREIWRWMLFALLVAMIGELFLQQRIVGRGSVTGTT